MMFFIEILQFTMIIIITFIFLAIAVRVITKIIMKTFFEEKNLEEQKKLKQGDKKWQKSQQNKEEML